MRKNLLILTSIFFGIGISFSMVPFIKSMEPTPRAINALPYIDLSSIERGKYKFVNIHAYPNKYNNDAWGVLVIRRKNGEFNLWDVVISNNMIAMPDGHWWNTYQLCKNFGPTLLDGIILEDKPIACHDTKGVSKWSKREWQWSISGKNLGQWTDDLHPTKGVIKDDIFIFSKDS